MAVALAKIASKVASSKLGQNIANKVMSSDLGQSVIQQVASADFGENTTPEINNMVEYTRPNINNIVESTTPDINNIVETGLSKAVELKDKFDSKLDQYYWRLRIVLVLVVVTIISIIIYRYKLPIICYGCESPEGFSKYIFKCVTDTSKDSDLCKISSAIDRGTEGIMAEYDKITVISRSVFKHLSKDIPEIIKDALTNIINQISSLVQDVISDITYLGDKFATFLSDIYNPIKNTVIKTKDDLYNVIIKPIFDFISSSIITPISTIITQLLSFKDIVSESISNTISKTTGVFVDLKNNIISPLINLPKSLEEFINQIIDFMNSFAKGGAKITRDSINTIVDGINSAINQIIGFLNDFAKGGAKITRDSIHTIVDGINTAVNTTVGGINTATSGISTGLSTAVDPIVNVVNDVVGGVNKVLDIKVPALKLPQVDFPSLNFGALGSTPSTKIIGETTLIPEWTPFSSISKASSVQFDGIKIPDIPSVSIPKPTIDDPTPVKDVNIPKPTINDPNEIPHVNLDKVKNDINNGLSSAYDAATSGIRKVYNDAMDPINTAIASLVGLATTLTASIQLFFNTYLNMDFLTNVLTQIKDKVYITVGDVIDIIKTKVFDPVYTIILQRKDKIANIVKNVINSLKSVVETIVEKTNTLFNTLSDTLYSTGMFIVKNIFYLSFYAFVNFVDKLIPLQVSKTVKVNFFLVTIVYVLFLYFTSQIRAVIKEALSQYYILFLLLLSFLALYFLFPNKEEVIKISSDIKQTIPPIQLAVEKFASIQPNLVQLIPSNFPIKEKYENIEPYSLKHKLQFSKVKF